jgi:hypothetical protein
MRFFHNIIITILLTYSLLSGAQNSILNDTVLPKKYMVYKTAKKLKIDGLAEEDSWQKAPFTSSFIDIEGIKKPVYDTRVKMLWDDENLYVYAVLEEPHLWGNLKQRDTVIYYNNDFEIFIDPSNNTYNYGEIEINVLGTLWDLKLSKPYKVSGKADNSWDIEGIQYAIHTFGTVNNYMDIDTQWSVEFAIPLSKLADLKEEKKTIPIYGEQWRINFSRVQWEHEIIDGRYYRKKVDGKFLPEFNWVWSNQKVINMHEPEKWGIIQFSTLQPGEVDVFIEDEGLLQKQLVYAFFRKNLALLRKNPDEIKSSVEEFKIDNQHFKYQLKKIANGFEITLKEINSKHIYYIDQEGLLKKI